MKRTRWLPLQQWQAHTTSTLETLEGRAAVGIRGALDAHTAHDWATRVLTARSDLVDDFGGEQHALGRAFYTHLETGRAPTYFSDAADSDALVERVLPGMQARTMELLQSLLGGRVRRRHGFCGPGVHVFFAGSNVAKRGGVFHYDLDGLNAWQRQQKPPAVSLVWMLQPAQSGGGLRLFQHRYRTTLWAMDRTPGVPCTTTRALAGDALLFSSYRLHRICGFGGDAARISITCHAVHVDGGWWDVWF
jgi:hypothetical protein